jgi:glutathione synthase/RimK-type ligase-like ATP-grasp enzyme
MDLFKTTMKNLMKIAIHHTPGTFSDRWIEYCRKEGLDYKLVNCYASDIIEQIKGCDALMWHFHHGNYKDVLFAKQLLYTVEQSGKKTFPDHKTCWHFDDKIGQKYLLESLGLPLVPSYIFYTRKEAEQWIEKTSFPKVFKLRSGAGSLNVQLVKSSAQAKKLTKKAFGSGFSQFNRIEHLKEQIRLYRKGKSPIMGVFKGLGRLFISTEWARMRGREKGYVYFQDFLPNNHFDIRIIIINGKAFGAKRMVRENDFRASGSGQLYYEKEHIPIDTVILAFELSEKLQSQCTAFDFIYNAQSKPMVVEISYGFPTKVVSHCTGYWDRSLQFHEGPFHPEYWMVEALLIKQKDFSLK